MTTAAFVGPGRYVQGTDVLEAAAEQFGRLDADRALLVGGETALSVVGGALTEALETGGTEVERRSGVDSCTESRVTQLRNRITGTGADIDLVVGVGGGTALDAAKAAASRSQTEYAAVPTVPSTNAAASSVAVLYDEHGRTAGTELRDRPPELVLADTSVLADAPADYLRHGLGDALAARFEAAACAEADGRTVHGTAPTDVGRSIARRVHGVIVERGTEALADAERGEPTVAVGSAVEAILLGSALGFENGGLAGAHALEVGFRVAGVTEPPHGLLVGFCTLAQLHVEDAPAAASVANLLDDLGLDVTLDELNVDEETLRRIGSAACAETTSMGNEPLDVTPEMAVEALRAASADLA